MTDSKVGTFTLFSTAAFGLMIAQRMANSLLLDWVKEERPDGSYGYPYEAASYSLFGALLGCIFGVGLSTFTSGYDISIKGFWNVVSLKELALTAVLYSLDDIFEIEATNLSHNNVLYTILNQLKLVLTAVVAVFILKRMKLRISQWGALSIITAGLVGYSAIGLKTGEASTLVLILTTGKVLVSVFANVECEHAFKKNQSPFLMQFSYLKFIQTFLLVVYIFFKFCIRSIYHEFYPTETAPVNWNLFHGWSAKACLVLFLAYVCKSLFTQLVLKNLDANLKNIAEFIAMVLVFVWAGTHTANRIVWISVISVGIIVYLSLKIKFDKKNAQEKVLTEQLANTNNKDAFSPTRRPKSASKGDAVAVHAVETGVANELEEPMLQKQ